jgi:carbon-monoxide dehydrogenase medium subunit
MITMPFEYARAASVEDTIERLRKSNGNAKLIAGGHSLVPLMKLRLSEPSLLIDIARIPGLAGVRRVGDRIEIGAGTTHHEVAASQLLREACPMLSDTAAEIGDQQVRNRGTLGGSLAHADPAADYPAAILALDADIHVQGPSGARVAKAATFFQGLFTVDLGADEVITSVQFTPVRSAAYAKLHQRASHFAIVGVAAALELEGKKISGARVGLTGARASAVRLTDVEQKLIGAAATSDGVEAAAQGAGGGLDDVNSDLHASEEYRRAMISVFTRRALVAAIERSA